MSTHKISREEIPLATTHLVRDACLCLHVQRAARALARRFDEALRPLALTQGQFSLLMSLNRPQPPADHHRGRPCAAEQGLSAVEAGARRDGTPNHRYWS